MNTRTLLVLLFFFGVIIPAKAQYVSLTKENNGTNSLIIPAGECWQLVTVSINSPEGTLSIYSSTNYNSSGLIGNLYNTGGSLFSSESSVSSSSFGYLGAIITGPAYLRNIETCWSYHLTFKKLNLSGSNTVSATSVVIPSSASGDVDVKMEQSADNVTWTECLPGTYNSSTVKRFFRLRAVEK